MTDDTRPPLAHKIRIPQPWVPASSHSDPALFKQRMQARMMQAQAVRDEARSKTVTIPFGKRGWAPQGKP